MCWFIYKSAFRGGGDLKLVPQGFCRYCYSEGEYPKESSLLLNIKSRLFRHNSRNDKYGFTLAEVLITLGIIGVVAAMTLPMLISNNNKTEVETRLQRVDSILNSVVKLAENDYGEPQYWDNASSPEFLKTYFMPYLPGSSFVGESYMGNYRVYTADGNDSFTLNGGFASGIKLKTGEIIQISNGLNQASGLLQIGVLLKQNKTGKYISGKDYFTFFMDTSKGVVDVKPWAEKWGVQSCNDKRDLLLEQCKTSTGHSALCLMLIECNGWKIPKDYPVRL